MKTILILLLLLFPAYLSAQLTPNTVGANTNHGAKGSYGNREGEPCEQGKTEITWRWHKTFACSIADIAVVGCGTTPGTADLVSKAREFVTKAAKWGGKVLKYVDAISKASSLAKTHDIYVHIVQHWTDYDVTYRCVNGVWVSVGMKIVADGPPTDMGWKKLRKTSDATCWTGAESEAELAEAMRTALDGCP